MNKIDRRIARAAGFLLCAVFVSALFPATASALWNENGNLVAISGANSYRAIPDGGGGAFLAWQAVNGVGLDIYVQHIDPAGNPVWTPGGINASGIPTTNELYPSLVADGAGGVFVAWTDGRDGHLDIYMQHVDETGTPAWAGGIGAVIWPGDQSSQSIVSDGSGGVVIAWQDARSVANNDIRAQRMNAAGVHQWSTGGALVCSQSATQANPYIISDGAGGVLAAFEDYRLSVDKDIYAGYLDGTGLSVWSDSGVAVCEASGEQWLVPIVTDGAGGFISVWADERGSSVDIYAQRIDPTGTARWTTDGVAISAANLVQTSPALVPDGHGGAVVTWIDGRDPLDVDIYAQRIDGSGYVLWDYDGSPVCAATGNQYGPSVARITPELFVFAWDDPRDGPDDVYAQALTLNGLEAWSSDGVLVAQGAWNQYGVRIAADATGSAILAFNNGRSGRSDLCTQRIEWRHGEWGHPDCELVSVEDVPADEGGFVVVRWNASERDRLADDLLTAYQVWRSMEPPAVAALAEGNAGVTLVLNPTDASAAPSGRVIWREGPRNAPQYWELVATDTPAQQEGYLSTVSTPQDSISNNPGVYWYKVLSVSHDKHWESGQVPGYSVDNLAPAAPLMLAAQRVGTDVVLEWNPSSESEPDFRDYVVYRGAASGVTPQPIFYLSETPDTLLTDTNAPTGTLYYIVTSRDIHENQSAPSNEASVSPVTGIGNPAPALTSLQLDANIPNPFSASTELRIGLPAPATVTVEVFDVAGRRVATREAALDAGWQSLRFDGRDASGRLLPSGVYFYRINAAGETLTRKLVIHR
jgi:hypothetical protein